MLSTNFSLMELIKSSTASRMGIENYPDADQMYSLKTLAETILQPIRNHYDIPFSVCGGSRANEVSKES